MINSDFFVPSSCSLRGSSYTLLHVPSLLQAQTLENEQCHSNKCAPQYSIISLPSDLFSMRVRMGTFHMGPLRKLTRESKTQLSAPSAILDPHCTAGFTNLRRRSLRRQVFSKVESRRSTGHWAVDHKPQSTGSSDFLPGLKKIETGSS